MICSPLAEDIELLPDLGDRKPFLSWPCTHMHTIYHTHKRTSIFEFVFLRSLHYQTRKSTYAMTHKRDELIIFVQSFFRYFEAFRKVSTHIDNGERVSLGTLVFVCVSPHRSVLAQRSDHSGHWINHRTLALVQKKHLYREQRVNLGRHLLP